LPSNAFLLTGVTILESGAVEGNVLVSKPLQLKQLRVCSLTTYWMVRFYTIGEAISISSLGDADPRHRIYHPYLQAAEKWQDISNVLD